MHHYLFLVVLPILASEQMVRVQINLFQDPLNVVEGVETFGLTLSVNNVENRFATFMFGDYPSTLVHISDRREFKLMLQHPCLTCRQQNVYRVEQNV